MRRRDALKSILGTGVGLVIAPMVKILPAAAVIAPMPAISTAAVDTDRLAELTGSFIQDKLRENAFTTKLLAPIEQEGDAK